MVRPAGVLGKVRLFESLASASSGGLRGRLLLTARLLEEGRGPGPDEIHYLLGLRPLFDRLLKGRGIGSTGGRVEALRADLPPVSVRYGLLPADLDRLAGQVREVWGLYEAGDLIRARERLESLMFPPVPMTRVVDLGAGYGDLAIWLSRRYPETAVWAVDQNPIPALDGVVTPLHLFNVSGYRFDDFLETFVRRSGLTFDRATIVMPSHGEIGDFVEAALEMLHPRGQIQILIDDLREAGRARRLLMAAGLPAAIFPVPFEAAPQTTHVRAIETFDRGRHPTLYWIVTGRRDALHDDPAFPEFWIRLGEPVREALPVLIGKTAGARTEDPGR